MNITFNKRNKVVQEKMEMLAVVIFNLLILNIL
jgi:hypothetical protein